MYFIDSVTVLIVLLYCIETTFEYKEINLVAILSQLWDSTNEDVSAESFLTQSAFDLQKLKIKEVSNKARHFK